MKYLKTVIFALLIAVLSASPPLHFNVCYGDKPSSDIVNNVFSSVMIVSHKELKTSAWNAFRLSALIAGTAAGTGSFGVGRLTSPVHVSGSLGTGFQTRWGVMTNSHVMQDKFKIVLTTFHKTKYHIKKINRKYSKEKQISQYYTGLKQTTLKEATLYDWGGMNSELDLALIRVKIPGAFELPLAEKVNIGEKVFSLGHPEGKKYVLTPIGTIKRYRYSGEIKYIELSIKGAQGRSGSPIVNIKGEVAGILTGSDVYSGATEAIHVDELRRALGLQIHEIPKKRYLPDIKSWNGAVYSTQYSRLFHCPDCNELVSNSDNLITFPSKESAMKDGAKPCPECTP